MNSYEKEQSVLLRTFDLPDIYFSAVAGLEGGGSSFQALRKASNADIESIALDKWYDESRLAADAEARRDCWLQIGDNIYVIWGAVIASRTASDENGGILERWEFNFSEMRLYKPLPS